MKIFCDENSDHQFEYIINASTRIQQKLPSRSTSMFRTSVSLSSGSGHNGISTGEWKSEISVLFLFLIVIKYVYNKSLFMEEHIIDCLCASCKLLVHIILYSLCAIIKNCILKSMLQTIRQKMSVYEVYIYCTPFHLLYIHACLHYCIYFTDCMNDIPQLYQLRGCASNATYPASLNRSHCTMQLCVNCIGSSAWSVACTAFTCLIYCSRAVFT